MGADAANVPLDAAEHTWAVLTAQVEAFVNTWEAALELLVVEVVDLGLPRARQHGADERAPDHARERDRDVEDRSGGAVHSAEQEDGREAEQEPDPRALEPRAEADLPGLEGVVVSLAGLDQRRGAWGASKPRARACSTVSVRLWVPSLA